MKFTINNLQLIINRGLPRKIFSKKFIRGQSLFEVVIGLAVVTLVLTSLAVLATTSLRNSGFSKNNSLATRYLQEASEWLRGKKGEGWTVFLGNAQKCTGGAKCCVNTSPLVSSTSLTAGACSSSQTVGGIFTREVTFSCFHSAGLVTPNPVACSDATADTVSASVSVSWKDGQGMHTVFGTTQFTNWNAGG